MAAEVPNGSGSKPNWIARVGWLVLLWVSGVVGLGAVALLLRAVMHAVG